MITRFVLDSSIVAAWCFPDEGNDLTTSVLRALALNYEAVAPSLWAYEVRNSILMGLRRRRLSTSDAQQFLESLQELPVHLTDPASYDSVFDLAREFELTVYDAAYLDLAIREKLPLSSLDKALCQAADKAGVILFEPENRAF